MKLLYISNTLNALVQSSGYFKSFHAGYHSDINTNILNNYNPDGNEGKKLPLVLWAVPVEGNLKGVTDRGTMEVEVELYFYGYQDYNKDGDPTPQTMMTVWDDLHTHAVEFLHTLKASLRIPFAGDNIKWFTDANATVDRLICIGATFTLTVQYGCTDYQSSVPLAPVDVSAISKTVDKETIWG